MEIEVKIDKNCNEPKITIHAAEMNEEIQDLLKKLTEPTIQSIVGYKQEVATILTPQELIRIYTENQKVFAETHTDKYMLKHRLFELENSLSKKDFLRISNSEIINLQQIKNLDLSFSGTICIDMKNNTMVYASRRYVSKIKNNLGL